MAAGNKLTCDFKLSHVDHKKLQIYLDYLDIKLPTLLRYLVKLELKNNEYLYKLYLTTSRLRPAARQSKKKADTQPCQS